MLCHVGFCFTEGSLIRLPNCFPPSACSFIQILLSSDVSSAQLLTREFLYFPCPLCCLLPLDQYQSNCGITRTDELRGIKGTSSSPSPGGFGKSGVIADNRSTAATSLTASTEATGSVSTGDSKHSWSSHLFSSTEELKEVVHSLMCLSQTPDGPTTSTTASSGTPKGGGGAGGSGGGGAGGGVGGSGGGIGVKLACSLGLLTLGLSDAASSLDAERRVCIWRYVYETGLSGEETTFLVISFEIQCISMTGFASWL